MTIRLNRHTQPPLTQNDNGKNIYIENSQFTRLLCDRILAEGPTRKYADDCVIHTHSIRTRTDSNKKKQQKTRTNIGINYHATHYYIFLFVQSVCVCVTQLMPIYAKCEYIGLIFFGRTVNL